MTALIQGDTVHHAATFSYADLDPETAAVAMAAASAVRESHKRFIPEVGRHLLRAKKVLPHGDFEKWVQHELGITPRSARNYMDAAQWLEGKSETLSVLPPTVLYALASPAAPDELVHDVVNEAAAGSFLDVPAIRAKLDAARFEQAELKQARKHRPKMTQAELRTWKARQHKKAVAEQARRADEAERESKNRHDRLAPLAQQVAGLCTRLAAALLPVLAHHQDMQAFTELLRDLLNRAANPTVQS